MTPERLVSESINSPHWKNWHLKRSKLLSRDCFSYFMFSGAADTTVDQLCRPHTLSRTLGVQLEILALTQVAIKFTTEGAGRCAWLATSTNLFLGQPSTIVWRYLPYQEQGMITLGGGVVGLKEYQFCVLSSCLTNFWSLEPRTSGL